MFTIFLMGMVPPILLILYMYRLDRIEREPFGLLLKLFLLGGCTTIAAGILEEIGVGILDALAETPGNLNYRFDAVVYSVAVSLGFAAFENVMYILNFGLGVAPIRAITAIPMHCITGIFMGHYYGQAKFQEYYHSWNGMYAYNVLAYVIPVLLHGFYDFAAGSEDELLSLLFLAYVVIIDIIAFLSVRHYAKQDTAV